MKTLVAAILLATLLFQIDAVRAAPLAPLSMSASAAPGGGASGDDDDGRACDGGPNAPVQARDAQLRSDRQRQAAPAVRVGEAERSFAIGEQASARR